MDKTFTPQKTGLGWVIELPPEVAQAMGVAEGSLAVLHPKTGTVEVEILPPPTPALEDTVRRLDDKYKETFAELKRLGD